MALLRVTKADLIPLRVPPKKVKAGAFAVPFRMLKRNKYDWRYLKIN